MRRLLTYTALAALLITVSACRKEEQNRPLSFDKGVYSGPADQKLSPQTLRKLRDRVRLQAGGNI